MALSIGFRVSVSLHPAIQATGRLALAPAELAPASRTCLSLDTQLPDPPAPAAKVGSSSRGPSWALRLALRPPLAWRLGGWRGGVEAFRTSSTTSCHQCLAGALSSPS